MHTTIEETIVIQKTKELCQTILDQPDIQALRGQIDAFLANAPVRAQYDALMLKGQSLQQKQNNGETLEDAEIAEFETLRDGFVNHPVGRGFLDAQEELQQIQQSVSQYISKTFELGRVPEESDLECGSGGGGCGSGGCGCH